MGKASGGAGRGGATVKRVQTQAEYEAATIAADRALSARWPTSAREQAELDRMSAAVRALTESPRAKAEIAKRKAIDADAERNLPRIRAELMKILPDWRGPAEPSSLARAVASRLKRPEWYSNGSDALWKEASLAAEALYRAGRR